MSEPDLLRGVTASRPASVVLDPHPAAVRHARAFVRAQCEAAGLGDDVTETAVLLTSEVVTNAFLHGRSRTRLSVHVDGGVLRVEVGDDNPRRPVIEAWDQNALDGRGMNMVDVLADAWGVREEAIGKTVWFTVRHEWVVSASPRGW